MIAVLFLILLVCMFGAGAAMLSTTVTCLRAMFALLDAFVQQVPRGVMLFLRLATWTVVRLVKASRYLWRHSRRIGVAVAQHVYVWLFVGSFLLREWYVANELKHRGAE